MATLAYTIRKVEKVAPVQNMGGRYTAIKNGKVLEFMPNHWYDSIATIRVAHSADMTEDTEADWNYFNNIGRALRYLEGN